MLGNNLNKSFSQYLYTSFPSKNSSNTNMLDIHMPNIFNNKYYINLINHQGLLTFDQALYTDSHNKENV